VFLLQSSGYPVGTAKQFPEGPPGIEPIYKTVTSQAITPITETSTVYYYPGGQFTRHTEEERLRRQIDLFGVAFREDKVMIEAQQAVINRSPDKMMMNIIVRSFGCAISPTDGDADGCRGEVRTRCMRVFASSVWLQLRTVTDSDRRKEVLQSGRNGASNSSRLVLAHLLSPLQDGTPHS
jgi:Vanillate O-demethylase oxygenase C-terminal domain